MPAASGKPPLSSIDSRTGRRCTTLTQLPEEFSGGSSEKLDPVPGLVDSHGALEALAGIGVDREGRVLARAAYG